MPQRIYNRVTINDTVDILIVTQLANKPYVCVVWMHVYSFTIKWKINSIFPGQVIHTLEDIMGCGAAILCMEGRWRCLAAIAGGDATLQSCYGSPVPRPALCWKAWGRG